MRRRAGGRRHCGAFLSAQRKRTRIRRMISAHPSTRRWRSEGSRLEWSGAPPAVSTGPLDVPTAQSVTTALRCARTHTHMTQYIILLFTDGKFKLLFQWVMFALFFKLLCRTLITTVHGWTTVSAGGTTDTSSSSFCRWQRTSWPCLALACSLYSVIATTSTTCTPLSRILYRVAVPGLQMRLLLKLLKAV